MARLQILQLPSDDTTKPFVLVVDQSVPQRIALGPDIPFRDYWQDLADKIGARGVIVTPETVDIPANDVPVDPDGYPLKVRIEGDFEQFREQVQEETLYAQGKVTRALRTTDQDRKDSITDALGMDRTRDWDDIRNAAAGIRKERDEARQWARHGYEIGQQHCGWSDHGVAPDWLTEGWPNSFDSCEHLKHAAELDETIARVRAVPTTPEIMNADQERADVWLHGYGIGVRAAKAALNPRNEPTVKP